MSVKLETAYHEAGHIVLAWFSKYHTIAGGIDLTKSSGQIPEIAVSKSKMSAAKKLPSKDTASNDYDVVREAAVIFTAGYQAELVAASINPSLAPDRGSADLDYEIVVVGENEDFLWLIETLVQDIGNLTNHCRRLAGPCGRDQEIAVLKPNTGFPLLVRQ